jgi:hypothetical protein
MVYNFTPENGRVIRVEILDSFRPQMALFCNFGVNRRNRMCGARECASARFLDFLEFAGNCTFLDRKLVSALYKTADGH